MRIEELHLKNFRCFKELDIQFPESNLAVFIGLNGAGKSAILDAITLLFTEYFDGEKNILLAGGIYKGLSEDFVTKKANIKYGQDDINTSSFLTEGDISFNFTEKNSLLEFSFNRVGYKTCKKDDWINKLTQKECKKFICLYYKTDRKINYVLDFWGGWKTDFEKFESFFTNEENIENAAKIRKKDFDFVNPRLQFVREAITLFFTNISGKSFSNLRVEREIRSENITGSYADEVEKHSSCLVIEYNNEELKISQLSSGQRLLLHLVGDIAYKLMVYSEFDDDNLLNNDNPLDKTGVILIDEIELHLHPQWQREVLPALQKTFPNIQFIVTTHSPQVLSRVHKDDIFILKNNQLYQPSSNPIGRDSSDILAEIMEVTKRPKEIQELSDKYFSLLNRNLFEEAQTIREELLTKLDSEDPIFIRADGLITRKQLLRK